MSREAAKAHVEYDPMMDGVSIYVSPEPNVLIHWGEVTMVRSSPDEVAVMPPVEARLRLREDWARALFEGLSRFFGGDAVDARRLRRDYDAERKRVDKFIDATISMQARRNES